jgi:hypothetical protein
MLCISAAFQIASQHVITGCNTLYLAPLLHKFERMKSVPDAARQIEALGLLLQEDMEVLPMKGSPLTHHFHHFLQHGARYKRDTAQPTRWR